MEPITRKEKFLAKAGGQNIELPNPVTREEMFLAAISGGGGGGDEYIVHVTVEYGGNLVCDKTFAEIEAAITEQANGGKLVIIKLYDATLIFISAVSGEYAKFCGMKFAPPNGIMRATLTFLKDGTIEATEEFANLSSLFTE